MVFISCLTLFFALTPKTTAENSLFPSSFLLTPLQIYFLFFSLYFIYLQLINQISEWKNTGCLNKSKKKKEVREKMARQIKIHKVCLALLHSVLYLEPGFFLKMCVGVFFSVLVKEGSLNAQISCDSCQS